MTSLCFWTALFVEAGCAITQSGALIVIVARGSYSRDEVAAASLTVAIDTVLLLVEAWLVHRQLDGDPDDDFNDFLFRVWAAVMLILGVGIFGSPILHLKLTRKRSVVRFKYPVSAKLLLSLPLLSCLASLALAFLTRDGLNGNGLNSVSLVELWNSTSLSIGSVCSSLSHAGVLYLV